MVLKCQVEIGMLWQCSYNATTFLLIWFNWVILPPRQFRLFFKWHACLNVFHSQIVLTCVQVWPRLQCPVSFYTLLELCKGTSDHKETSK